MGVQMNKEKNTFTLTNSQVASNSFLEITGITKLAEIHGYKGSTDIEEGKPGKPGDETKPSPSGSVTILTYDGGLQMNDISKLLIKIKKQCQCQVQMNKEKNTFTLTNSKVASNSFLEITGITKWAEKHGEGSTDIEEGKPGKPGDETKPSTSGSVTILT